MNAFESCFDAFYRCRETTWPRCTSAQRNIQRLLSSWEWWIDGRVTIAFRMNENPDHETHHDCCLSPHTTTSLYYLLSKCSLSYKLTKKNFGQMKATTCCWIRAILIALLFQWFHQIAALHFSAMDLLLLGCQLSKFSVNWKICFLQIAIACSNSSRFTRYLFLNKCNLEFLSLHDHFRV